MEKDNLTQKDTIKVYNLTTKPKKPKRRDKSDLGENFVAPDGGWAWVVCIAAGISNLAVLPNLQQFGLIYRDRLYEIGLTSSQITTIVNVQPAVSAFTGLINGAMFRRFSIRQVAFAGSVIISISIFLSAFANSFWSYIWFFSIFFGFGMGINMSASSLAINTYFKKNRRRAMGFSWTITGLGPIFLPHIVTVLLYYYGVQGTVILFSALTMQGIVASMVYQPVEWHTKPQPEEDTTLDETPEEAEYMCKFCEMSKLRKPSLFSSQYLFSEDDAAKPGFEIIEPGTPMMSRANDGWHGSKLSLNSVDQRSAPRQRKASMARDAEEGRLDRVNSQEELQTGELYKPNHFHREKEQIELYTSKLSLYSDRRCTCAVEKALLQKTRENTLINSKTTYVIKEPRERVSFFKKVSTFFDLDLMRDPIFCNLVVGMTIIIFGELNFSILTPFILNNFGLTDPQISTAMSIIGGMDISVRFLSPFVTQKIKWDNKVFFAFGMICIALGRAVVAMTRNYELILMAFVFIGFGKGLRTVFAPLIIPSYVPLKRLPAASGLQLILNGCFTLTCGPMVGLITDAYGYSVTIHVINAFTFIAIFSWTIQGWVLSYRQKKKEEECIQE